MRTSSVNWLNRCFRENLLRSASILAIATVICGVPASAQSAGALRSAAGIATTVTHAAAATNGQTSLSQSPDAASASVRALQNAARAQSALDLGLQAQAAARAAAAAVTPHVPDGLVFGGLNPVTNPVPAAEDPGGLKTWEGAKAPTQTTSGSDVKVTIEQTQSRAVLDWQTFNVGKNTTVVFEQKQNGKAQTDWVALNRVVGQIDPNTGMRDASQAPAPSQILGAIKADGTVVVLNQNGVLFGATSQVDTNSLVATSLEIGRAVTASGTPLTIGQRNAEFLNFGFLGFADEASVAEKSTAFTFSAQALSATQNDPNIEGAIQVEAGATITAGDQGFILLTGPKIVNSGHLVASNGQVSLQAGRQITLQRSDGSATGVDSNIRGFVVSALNRIDAAGSFVENSGVIESPRGYILLGSTSNGAVINDGVLSSTTSVSRNGFIQLTGGDIRLTSSSVVSVTADTDKETIPQDSESLSDFKSSRISIGSSNSRIEMDGDSLVYAPSGNILVGADPGATTLPDAATPGTSRIFIDSGAVIDAAGLTDVVVPASRNAIKISPVKGNELANDPNYKDSFLNGATVYVDPRISGVRSDGVAWIGSPLIDAESYYEQVGVSAAELMTKGGNVTLGTQSFSQRADLTQIPDVIVKSGAVIDISGGWVTYAAGVVQTTELITASGGIVDISRADPNGSYIGIFAGYADSQPRWGISQVWSNPLLQGVRYEGSYTEGRDAGSLTIKSSAIVLDGTVYAAAYPGAQQILDGEAGTGTSTVYGDGRAVQAAPSQLPSGGFLFIEALGTDSGGNVTGGADVAIVDAAGYQTVSADFGYGQSVSVGADLNLIVPARDPASLLPASRESTILLSDQALSGMGLGQLSIQTSGTVTDQAGTSVSLAAGGIVNVLAGRAITIDGAISAASGKINLQTTDVGFGSVLAPTDAGAGSFDIVVNGTLSTRGRWVNDFGAAPGELSGDFYTSGGSISLSAAPRVTLYSQIATVSDTLSGKAPSTNVDISGSILLNAGSRVDVSGGGYVKPDGSFDTTARGGNLSLVSETTYFGLTDDPSRAPGGLTGLRIRGIKNPQGTEFVAVNPDTINARVVIAPGTVLAHGFGGGGTFSLTTPEFSFGDATASTGTELPMDFFSAAGFASYNIVSYKTALTPNTFGNGLGGYNAVLATQELTVGAGETLRLTQSYFSPLLDTGQMAQLRALQTGGDLYSILTPTIPADAWDRKAINLTLGGTIELDVAAGGKIVGEAGGKLAVASLLNEGTIVIPGGTIGQSQLLPSVNTGPNAIAVTDLSAVFSVGADGSIDPNAPNAIGILNPYAPGKLLTNGQVASQYSIYLLGNLAQNEGVRLAPGSVTDLAGVAIVNPRARAESGGQLKDGVVVAGGTLSTAHTLITNAKLFDASLGVSVYGAENSLGVVTAAVLDASPGAVIDISGASATFDRLAADTTYQPTGVWSNGGTLSLGNGGTLTGASIAAKGGAPEALGGTLVVLDPVLYQSDPAAPTANAISAEMIGEAGFDTFEAQGSLSASGDVTLSLGRGFFLVSRPYGGEDFTSAAVRDKYVPIVGSTGTLQITAPYIGLDGQYQSISNPHVGTPGAGTVVFAADQIDVTGAVVFDSSVAQVNLDAAGDLRLIGVKPWQQTLNIGADTVSNSLSGQLVVNGDLAITAAQVYPATGSSFLIASTAAGGLIQFARSTQSTPAAPYSAGGNLLVQAANIEQDGVIRVPLGTLTLGSDSELDIQTGGVKSMFAPQTQTLVVGAGSITSVSADGLDIPYGTTTDQTEWFFTPTSGDRLTAPPSGVLQMSGASIDLQNGATVDLKGGGDLYAYEFIPGTGGSHDVLSQTNEDPATSNNGYLYPDKRQVYAIVPGLSGAAAAAYDPIYSSGYDDLYGVSGAGKQVYLSGGQGLAAGWYTLLPAKYAMLPGGMRVVVDTGVGAAVPGASQTLDDGTLVVSGYFGDAGTGKYDSTILSFDVQSQSVFRNFSDIALTYASTAFSDLAEHNGVAVPRLPVDAGRLILNPVQSLSIDAAIETAPADGGRGAEVDISGNSFDITAQDGVAGASGTIVLSAQTLNNLNAASLLIGGVRTDNQDGTTTLNVTAGSIVVENDADHPVTGPTTILVVDGPGSTIDVAAGASIVASGTAGSGLTGNYIIQGRSASDNGLGAIVRVSNGPERLVTRSGQPHGAPSVLSVGEGATLSGNSVLLDSSGSADIGGTAQITANSIALGAADVAFADTASASSGLVITPELQTLLSAAKTLAIRGSQDIAFTAGSYTFGDVLFDAPVLSLLGGNAVALSAGKVVLQNSGSLAAACGSACGTGSLSIAGSEIDFGSGTIRTQGFGGSVTLKGQGGIFFDGVGALDAGGANLTLDAPFVGDRAIALTAGEAAVVPSLTISTAGNLSIIDTSASLDGEPDGTPGATLVLSAGSVDISDAVVRATAGTLQISSEAGVTLSGGARLETPGYSKTFGDAADAVQVSAPGGLLEIAAKSGNIDIGAGTTLSVGGGQGKAGTLELTAGQGTVTLAGTLDANAPGGGGSFLLDTSGGFDLSGFVAGVGAQFDGEVAVKTGSGGLTLASDEVLRAAAVVLVADRGTVAIAGTIDTSGVNGGDITLYGGNGVALAKGALLQAQATGYADSDTRQASGGTVEVGTDGAGKITVASGATIDVGARRTGDRMVPVVKDGVTYYTYVEADQGGVVHFRLPVSDTAAGETVKLFVGGTVAGARSIVVEGFKHFDLASVAADARFVGVTVNSAGQAVLDTAAAAAGKSNFLADLASGTLVDFVQNFDISASKSQFAGLWSSSQFHAQPGMELDYAGNIVLTSNWNLGAGVVDVAGAVAAGLMAPVSGVAGKYYVLPGADAEVFARFTRLTYRTGGAVDGEPGVLTLRAGGTLDIKGSITDGFFTFRDQTDPDYLNRALGGGAQSYTAYLSPSCVGTCTAVGSWQAGATPGSYVSISLPYNGGLLGLLDNPVPYDAAANAPSALGSYADGSGDPIGSAELFPLLPAAGGTTRAVASSSYRLVGGADLTSPDPLKVDAASAADVIVEGTRTYTYSGVRGTSSFNGDLLLQAGQQYVMAAQWLAAYTAQNPSLTADSYTTIDFSRAPAAARAALQSEAAAFFAGHSGKYEFVTSGTSVTGVKTTLGLAAAFFASVVAPNFSSVSSAYVAPAKSVVTKPTTATVSTLIRTGTGDIAVAAAGDVDLRNGVTTYRKLDGTSGTLASGGLQTGGSAIYTAGHLADLGTRVITDSLTGTQWTVDTGAYVSTGDVFANPPQSGYRYGAGGTPDYNGVGFSGILMADAVYATAGGGVSVEAGHDVLGRTDAWQSGRISAYYDSAKAYGYTWIGNGEQPWRVGAVGDATDIEVNPQLFTSGLGTLGGGSISVKAGNDISDLSVIATGAVVTADVTASRSSATQALWTLDSGDVLLSAGSDILGGRVDVASGAGSLVAHGSVADAGSIVTAPFALPVANDLWLRLSDAVVDISAGQSVELRAVTALGVQGATGQVEQNLDSFGFYSQGAGVSILADETVTVDNAGAGAITSGTVKATQYTYSAVYPGSFEAVSLTGDIDLVTALKKQNVAAEILLMPSPTGTLDLIAGADVSPVVLAMEDADPGLLPGAFSIFQADVAQGVIAGQTFIFPAVFSTTQRVALEAMHNRFITHAGDAVPNYVYAGGDIDNVILSVPKQTRINAGRDIVNMMFFGQNVAADDITRIVAGRDVVASTELVRPLVALPNTLGQPLSALAGNTFVVGGPGSFFLEAGRDAGPFLNSAVTNGFQNAAGATVSSGRQVYGGGILSVGNDWNPWLPEQGASLFVEFGIGKGADYDAFRDYYVDPANVANLDGSLFVQVKDAAGNPVPDRNQPIYAPILIDWMKNHAAALLTAAYGTLEVTYQQAYDVFKTLPELQQRVFLVGSVYFNELAQASIPSGPSYKQYSRGYEAVNTLFPSSLGYTKNDLSGGSLGATDTVATGNLDLRLSTIQTDRGGDIYILGPGGRVLAGSTVRTSDQAARRAYIGGSLYSGLVTNSPYPAAITSIPAGYEGVLTLRGGSINTFTDGDFLLNQSRLFTEGGGDITMWSSNGSLNAGQGPKTSANFPPIVVQTDEDLYTEVSSVGGVTGAGIAAFQPGADVEAPNVYLLAPRGTVDAGDAGVRVAGNLFIAAFAVANAENFTVGGTAFGIPVTRPIDVGVQNSASAASSAVAQAAQAAASSRSAGPAQSIITVDVLGYLVIGDQSGQDDEKKKRK
ncbi:MAG TPA: filamentous hemagglutinin family protein [Rhizomicrobium sp.]|nr:filamentous hemagglutinin family protein [Rhizomicrobium sp.]